MARRLDRLRSGTEFRRVFREGVRTRTTHLVVHAAPRPEAAAGRYGLVVSRQIGGAVVRNRRRRQLRAAVEMVGGIPAGWDAVIVATPGPGARTADLRQELESSIDGLRRRDSA